MSFMAEFNRRLIGSMDKFTFDQLRERPKESDMKVVYVAGKFRGPSAWDIECNIRQAEALALEVWRMGAAALCPHTNTRFFQNAAPDDVWLQGDLVLLERCDAMITVDNWRDSSGACAEVEHAKANGIPVFHDLLSLNVFLFGVPAARLRR
jgi:nucleoside 2-deoxyribosyltransferase